MDQNTNTPHEESKGIAIASMVLGIISLVLFCSPFICFPCGITSIVLGAICLVKKSAGNGMAIAGLICSIIAIAIYILFIAGLSILSSLL